MTTKDKLDTLVKIVNNEIWWKLGHEKHTSYLNIIQGFQLQNPLKLTEYDVKILNNIYKECREVLKKYYVGNKPTYEGVQFKTSAGARFLYTIKYKQKDEYDVTTDQGRKYPYPYKIIKQKFDEGSWIKIEVDPYIGICFRTTAPNHGVIYEIIKIDNKKEYQVRIKGEELNPEAVPWTEDQIKVLFADGTWLKEK